MRIMTHYQKLLRVSTTGKSFHNITAKIEAIVAESGIETGLCSLFLRHTSASLVIQENADPDVLVDLANFMAKIVPEGNYYIHNSEGPILSHYSVDDVPKHRFLAMFLILNDHD